MAQRDAEMAEVFIVLDREYENRLQEAVDSLKSSGVSVDRADDDNSIVEGTCTTRLIPQLQAMPMVKYVRIGVTWWADYPKGDPRDVIEPVIRRPTVRDAERMLKHIHAMADEAPDCLPLLPGEFQVTLEEERKIITDYNAADNSIFLLAEVDDDLVALCNAVGGKRQATRHCATLGISVRKAWQGKGIGTLLLQNVIDWAKTSGILRRLDLKVYADNDRGIALYKKLGFTTEGLRRQAILRNGQLIDDVEMAMIW